MIVGSSEEVTVGQRGREHIGALSGVPRSGVILGSVEVGGVLMVHGPGAEVRQGRGLKDSFGKWLQGLLLGGLLLAWSLMVAEQDDGGLVVPMALLGIEHREIGEGVVSAQGSRRA